MRESAGKQPSDSWRNSLPELRASLRGELILPEDGAYEEARKVWNGMINKRPALIVRCAGVSDVVHAVKFAGKNSLVVAVRGGGHNVAGNAICDDGLVIDLSKMRGVRVDPKQRTVWAQAGAVWSDIDKETQLFGMATTGGLVSSTGIAGFTLGGGIGWLMRKYGLACDNLASVELVTANGEFITASDKKNSDLFWGVRGGGGNFGVATSFEYKLHPVGPIVLGGLLLHDIDKAHDLLRFYTHFTSNAPDELTTMVAFITCPPAPFFPQALHGKSVVGVAVCYDGPVEEGRKIVKPLEEFAPPAVNLIGPMPYLELQTMFDPMNQPGSLNYWKSHYSASLEEKAIDTIIAQFAKVPSPLSEFHVQHLAGAIGRVASDTTAFSYRDAQFVFNIIGKWTTPEDSEHNIRWVRETWDALRPFMPGGVYVYFLADQTEDLVRASYTTRKYE